MKNGVDWMNQNRHYLLKSGKGSRGRGGKHSGTRAVPNINHLNRIINVLEEEPTGLRLVDVVEKTGISGDRVSRGLLWLNNKGLIIKIKDFRCSKLYYPSGAI
jgi:hypothetical protein